MSMEPEATGAAGEVLEPDAETSVTISNLSVSFDGFSSVRTAREKRP